MLKHFASWAYKEGVEQQQITQFEELIYSLAKDKEKKSLGILSVAIKSHKEVSDKDEGLNRGHTHVMVMRFKDAKSAQVYIESERHQGVFKKIMDLNIFDEEHPLQVLNIEEPVTPRTLKQSVLGTIKKKLEGGAINSEALASEITDCESVLNNADTNSSSYGRFYQNNLYSKDSTINILSCAISLLRKIQKDESLLESDITSLNQLILEDAEKLLGTTRNEKNQGVPLCGCAMI